MKIAGLEKNTMIDFPGAIACIVFAPGCNYDCFYCHNRQIIADTDARISEEEVISFLKKRAGLIDGVVISGGEALLQPDLAEFIRKVRHLGYLVKLDTNGSNPFKLKLLIDEGLLDYVAVDVKAPSSRYKEIAGGAADYLPVRKTADTLKASGIKWEMRTTAVPQLKKEDFVTIAKELPELPLYRINRYRVPETYKPEDRERILMTPHTAVELEEIRQAVLPIQPNTVLNL